MSRPLPGLVSYMSAGDDEPGLSKLSTTPAAYAHGSSRRNAWDPIRPRSSPSVNRKMMSLRGGGPERRARAVSSSAATPLPSSAAPGAVGTES